MFGSYPGTGSTNLAEYFRQSGSYTARVSKIFHMAVPGDIIAGTNGADIASSWTERFNSAGKEAHTPGSYACLNVNQFGNEPDDRQSTGMPHRMYVTVQADNDCQDQPDYKTATRAIELIRSHSDESFFIAVGFVRPHYPMVAPTQLFENYPHERMALPRTVDDDLQDIPALGITRTSAQCGIDRYPDNQRRMWQGYYAATEFMDAQVGRILNALDERGLREETAVVLLSDHGYHLGEHTFWLKANLHEEVIRVPLLISCPAVSPSRSDSIVELVDLYPTLCEVAGLPIPSGLDGTSLVPVLKDPERDVKSSAFSFTRDGVSCRAKDWAYMRYEDETEELYDMVNDPGQFTNIAGDRTYTDKLREMRQVLADRNLKGSTLRGPR